MDFRFISPLDLTSPAAAVFMGLTFLDIEDSGTPGRGTSRFILFSREDDSLVADIPIPSGPNGNQFPVIFPTFGPPRGDFFTPVGRAKALVGDDDDSGGLDSLCYNLEPCLLDLRLEIGSPGQSIRPGDRVALPLFIESIADRRTEVIASVTVRRQGGRRERILEAPKLVRLRPHFDNLDDPKRLILNVPERVGPRVARRPLELRAKLVHPTSGVILAQAMIELSLTVD
jgi:hypothetical protein